ncbi:MAG: cation:proton antiporter, partial [Phototrophicales bacterium]
AVNNIAYAFVVPIFFVSVGLKTDLSSFPLSALPFTIGLLLVAVSSKVIGCGLGAKLGGFNNFESLRVGVCMISRGEVGLIIAALGITSGVYQTSDPLFAALFMVILLTTVLTPVLVRWVFKLPNQNDESDNQSQTSPQQKPEYSIEV